MEAIVQKTILEQVLEVVVALLLTALVAEQAVISVAKLADFLMEKYVHQLNQKPVQKVVAVNGQFLDSLFGLGILNAVPVNRGGVWSKKCENIFTPSFLDGLVGRHGLNCG